MQYNSLCPLNGIKVEIIIFKSRSLYEFACQLATAFKKCPLVSLWEPIESESCGKDIPLDAIDKELWQHTKYLYGV